MCRFCSELNSTTHLLSIDVSMWNRGSLLRIRYSLVGVWHVVVTFRQGWALITFSNISCLSLWWFAITQDILINTAVVCDCHVVVVSQPMSDLVYRGLSLIPSRVTATEDSVGAYDTAMYVSLLFDRVLCGGWEWGDSTNVICRVVIIKVQCWHIAFMKVDQ